MNKYAQRVTELDPYYGKNKNAQKASEDALSEMETRLESTFPADYREFVTDFGGVALMTSPIFTFQEGDNPNSSSLIEQFYGVRSDDPQRHLATIYDIYRQRIPSDLLPIGEDPGANIVCLGIKGERRGKVFFWDHDREEMPPVPTPEDWEPGDSNLSFIADSFEEFFFSLQPQE